MPYVELGQLSNNVPTVASSAALPTFGVPGRVYYSTGDAALYVDTGAAWVPIATSGSDVTAGANFADNRIIRGDGAAKAVQSSAATLDDTGNLSGVAALATTSRLSNTAIVVTAATDAGSHTIANTTATQLLAPDAAPVPAFTLTMPAAPVDGQIVRIGNSHGTNTITALSVTTGAGSIIGALTALGVGAVATYQWSATDTKWYRV